MNQLCCQASPPHFSPQLLVVKDGPVIVCCIHNSFVHRVVCEWVRTIVLDLICGRKSRNRTNIRAKFCGGKNLDTQIIGHLAHYLHSMVCLEMTVLEGYLVKITVSSTESPGKAVLCAFVDFHTHGVKHKT